MRRKKRSWGTNFRLLAWALALGVAIGGWSYAPNRLSLFLQLAAALLFAVGAIWPRVFRRPYMLLISPLGRWARRAWFV
jgi:hypothetical protein